MQCLIDHIVLNIEDDERMLSFYIDVLQFEPERVAEYKAGDVPFPSVRLNQATIIDLFPKALWQDHQQKGRQNLNHFCLTLNSNDWHKLVDRLEMNGIEIADGPAVRWGAQGNGTSVYFRDPEANVIEVRYYEDSD